MKRHKILLVTTVPDTFLTILQGQPKFLDQRFSVSLATSPGAGIQEIREKEGVPVFSVPMTRGISPIRDLYSLFRMVILILRLRPHMVHSYTPKAGMIAMLASRLCFVPVRIHTFTGLVFPAQIGFKKQLLIFIDRIICSCASRVIPEGNGVRNDLISHSITNKDLQLIGNGNIAGVDTKYFSRFDDRLGKSAISLRNSLSLPSDAFVFCFVGRLNRDKGIAELSEAFLTLPENAHLLLVGGVDETLPVSADVMGVLRKNDRVHFLGFMKDVRPALYISDVFVLPSYREGFPNVLLQAGSMQLPIIATDVSGSNEIVTPPMNGWLVPARDALSLSRAMKVALKCSNEELMEMGALSRVQVQSKFEQREHRQRMVEFYTRELRS